MTLRYIVANCESLICAHNITISHGSRSRIKEVNSIQCHWKIVFEGDHDELVHGEVK
jgi:hypothetical protein